MSDKKDKAIEFISSYLAMREAFKADDTKLSFNELWDIKLEACDIEKILTISTLFESIKEIEDCNYFDQLVETFQEFEEAYFDCYWGYRH